MTQRQNYVQWVVDNSTGIVTGQELPFGSIVNPFPQSGGYLSTNIFYPEQFGAKADAFGAHDGVAGAGNTFSSATYTFTQADVGKNFWPSDGVLRTIVSVANGVATLSAASSGTTSVLFVLGTDDTIAIQAALNAAASVSTLPYATEPYFQEDQYRYSGGIVRLTPGKAYMISNSQASYNGGQLSALTIHRRTSLEGSGSGEHRSALMFQPNSYGHMIDNLSPSSFSDFIEIYNLNLYGYGPFSVNGLDALHLENNTGFYPSTDPYNRVRHVFVTQARRNGFFFAGKGELIVSECQAMNNTIGFSFNNVFDIKVIGCNAGGNYNNAFYINSTGASTFVGCKGYYSGSSGGTVDQNCSNWVLVGNQQGGLVSFTGCMAQESRGSSWFVQNGNNVFSACQAYDPGRQALAGGTLPTNMAGWNINSVNGRLNVFGDCVVGPSVVIYNNPNWQPNVSSVYIDDVDGNGAGPQVNRGHIWSYVTTVDAGGASTPGTQYSGTGGVKTGGGVSNGKNTNLFIDGVACT